MFRGKAFDFLFVSFLLVCTLFAPTLIGPQVTASEEIEEDCTVTLTPDQSIQEAVDKVQTGSVVCLSEGRWEEVVNINKSLTIRGLKGKPEIYSAKTYSWTIGAFRKSDSVKLQNLKISFFGESRHNMPIILSSSPLEINDCTISSTSKYGKTWGLAFNPGKKKEDLELKISDTTFKNTGVLIFPSEHRNESSKALIQSSVIKNSLDAGLRVRSHREHQYREYEGEQVEVTLKNTVITGAGDLYEDDFITALTASGIVLGDGAKAEIVDSTISDNTADGIFLYQSGEATIDGSVVENNGRNGVALWDLSNVTIFNSKISNNSGSGISLASWSRYAGNELEGKVLYQHEQLPSNIDASIKSNEIINNEKYGVFIYTDKCDPTGKEEHLPGRVIGFWGKVIGSSNTMKGNDRKDVCPPELSFLQSEEGGKYPPER